MEEYVLKIEKLINRINEEYNENSDNLKVIVKQDSIIMNIQRIKNNCISIMFLFFMRNKIKIKKEIKENIDYMEENRIVKKELCDSLRVLIDCSDIAVHDYQSLNLKIVLVVVEKHIYDSLKFAKVILEA